MGRVLTGSTHPARRAPGQRERCRSAAAGTMTLAHFVALDTFVASPSGCDECVAHLVAELQAELRVVLIDREGRPTPGAARLAAEGRRAIAAADAFYAVAEGLTETAGDSVVLPFDRWRRCPPEASERAITRRPTASRGVSRRRE